MGMLDWLFGRKQIRKPRNLPLPPSKLRENLLVQGVSRVSERKVAPGDVKVVDSNGWIVSFDQDGNNVFMDRDTYDYFYGEKKGKPPAQNDISSLWPMVTSVCVLEGYHFQGNAETSKILARSSDPRLIKQLSDALHIQENADLYYHCCCLGGPTLELYQGSKIVACIGIHHGKAIRYQPWSQDAVLVNGDKLTQWLYALHITPKQVQDIYQRGNNHILNPDVCEYPDYAKKADQLIEQAIECLKQNQYEAAVPFCNQAIELHPTHGGSYALRGFLYIKLNRDAEALNDYTTAIDRGFRRHDIYARQAAFLFENGNMGEALDACSNALRYNPSDSQALLVRGRIQAAQEKWDEAFADYAACIKADPESVEVRMHRAVLHHFRGDLTSALSDLDKCIALVEANLGSVSEAAVNNMLAILYSRRGNIKIDLFQESEAKADFDKALELDRQMALRVQGEIAMQRHTFRQAIDLYTQFLRLCPLNADILAIRGQAFEAIQEYDQALADYSEAIRLAENHSSAYLRRAFLQRLLGRNRDAVTDLNEHLCHHPNSPLALFQRSRILQEFKQYQQALEDKEKAYRLCPDEPAIVNSLSWMLATCPDERYRDNARALVLAQRACELTKYQVTELIDTLAAAHANAGNFDDATRWQSLALNLSPPQFAPARQHKLELYAKKQPYREDTQPVSPLAEVSSKAGRISSI